MMSASMMPTVVTSSLCRLRSTIRCGLRRFPVLVAVITNTILIIIHEIVTDTILIFIPITMIIANAVTIIIYETMTVIITIAVTVRI